MKQNTKKPVIWDIDNPFSLYEDTNRDAVTKEIKDAILDGSLNLMNLDRASILRRYTYIGASDTATRECIELMLKGVSYEEAYK